MNIADRATLRYMIDPNVIQKHDDIKDDESLDREDIDFYKERIKDLTEHLLEHGSPDDSLTTQFNDYVKACISYLHTSDVNETFQEKYTGFVYNPSIGNIEDVVCNDRLVCRPPKGRSIKDFVIVKNKPSPTSFPSEELFDAHNSRFKNKRIDKKENVDIIYGENKKMVAETKEKVHKKEKQKSEQKRKDRNKARKKDSQAEKREV